MKIRHIKQLDLRAEAIQEFIKGTGMQDNIVNRAIAKNAHLMMIDFGKTARGCDFWERIYNQHSPRPYRNDRGTIGGYSPSELKI